jgi:hypothetical protein
VDELMTNRMMKIGAALALVIVASATVALKAAQNRNLDFVLVNQTGLAIIELYVSPTSEDEWGDDILGRDVLETGEKANITFRSSLTECNWDLKIVDEDDDEIEWVKLNLCTANEITLKYENKRPTAIIK